MLPAMVCLFQGNSQDPQKECLVVISHRFNGQGCLQGTKDYQEVFDFWDTPIAEAGWLNHIK